MTYIALVLWLVLFPVAMSIESHLMYLRKRTYSKDIEYMSNTIIFAFYLFVAMYLAYKAG